MKQDGWINNLAYFVDVTGLFNNFSKELKIQMFVAEIYDNIKALKFKLRLWENQSKLHNLFHFSIFDT
jgi:hypothetical protein